MKANVLRTVIIRVTIRARVRVRVRVNGVRVITIVGGRSVVKSRQQTLTLRDNSWDNSEGNTCEGKLKLRHRSKQLRQTPKAKAKVKAKATSEGKHLRLRLRLRQPAKAIT